MRKENSKAGVIGFAAVAAKLAPKFVSLGKLVKVGLAAATVGVYASVFNWKFAVVIVTMLFVHESGHIWAMKRCGMTARGIYFIPFVGAMAVGDDLFPTRKAEVYVALMGPIWGLAYALAALCIFGAFHAPLFAAAASWAALVTLFNLLPINPLDGGRVIKSITYSISGRMGLITLIAGMALAVVVMIVLNVWIFALVITLNLIEMAIESAERRDGGKIARYARRREKYEQKIRIINEELYDSVVSFPRELRLEKRVAGLRRRINGLQKRELIEKDQKKRPELTPMTRPEILKSAAGILAVAAAAFIIMFSVSHIPGADLALDVLVDG
jgi:Zn-dependent protease